MRREFNPLVKGLTQFQYLVIAVEHMYNDWTEVQQNIGKAGVLW